jgi:two-component system sensor histidine kinase KdpD
MRLNALSRVELAVGVLASAGSVAFVSALVEVLRPYMPVLSLGVLYVFAVLAIAVFWGIELAVIVSVASMLKFNWFFLPPTHTFQLEDRANWAVLAVYLVTAVVVSALAARTRQRAEVAERREREAGVLAELAEGLLAGTELADELERVGVLTAGVLGVPHTRIALGVEAPAEGESAYPLAVADRRVGTVLVGSEHTVDREAADRFLPALASLLAVELERSGLEAEALDAEAFRRSDTIKTALLHAVSHDLRSPLTAIVAASSGLANPEVQLDEADRAALVETIRAEAERLNRLVGNLLDLTRLQSGVAASHPELWPVDGLVSRALEQLGPAEERVAMEVDDDAPPVFVDPVQIERVLVNLLENALKFSPPASTVRVRTEAGGNELLVHVLDLGPGVSPGMREAVFEAFRRGDEGAAIRGAGLGLAIARGFAEVNGARVWAEGDATGGHFVLALPVADRSLVSA